MTDLCAIQGQLVDVRNVGTHKCVKLTIHVPAEYAPRVIEAFGWATGVDPVPVAIARMNNGKEANPSEDPRVAKPAPEADNASPVRAPRKWDEITPAQQAGIRCNEPAFQQFLRESEKGNWDGCWPTVPAEKAAWIVRKFCEVQSRSEIREGTVSAETWNALESRYRAWQLAPGVGAA